MSSKLTAIALLLCAGLDQRQIDCVRAAYAKLDSAAIEAKPAASPPHAAEVARIDVSEGMRSASFGHTTTLLVPVPANDEAPKEFWVQYGRSTNAPARLFGPFPVADKK
jgi:hypothetical protein